jgi:hypothetical protein
MAGGGFSIDAPSNGFDGKITLSVIITCIVAASSGLSGGTRIFFLRGPLKQLYKN